MRKVYLFILTGLLLATVAVGQVAVIVTNPTNATPILAASYPSLANAITALNTITSIAGPVTLTCAAGTETAPAGGYQITFIASTTLANNVVITGTATTTIMASAALTVGALNDGIFKIIGSDYVTIQNFTMQENALNTTTAAATNNMTEWGVALLHASITNGAQNNTIQNNIISLNISYSNTFGIYSNARHSATAVITIQDITNNTTAPNNANKIYGNNISNVNMGICFIGSATAARMDVSNDIGGSSAATGNTITNWGGAASASAYVSNTATGSYCILVNHQTDENVSYNTITSAAISGSSVALRGIFKTYTDGTAPTAFISNITHNTITISDGFTSGTLEGITNQGISIVSGSTATVNIDNNTILNFVLSGFFTNTTLVCIRNSSAVSVLSISNNIIRGNTSTATNGGFVGIFNDFSIINTININNNQIGNASGGAITFSSATSGSIYGISNNMAVVVAATVNINNNSIEGITCVSSGSVFGVFNAGNTSVAVNMNDNKLGTVTGDFIRFTGVQNSTLYGIYNQGGTTACALTIEGNDIRRIVHVVTGAASHLYIISDKTVLSQNINNNTFTDLNVNTSGDVIFFYRFQGMAANGTSTCNGNSIVGTFNKTAAGNGVSFLSTSAPSVNGSTLTETGNNFSNVTVTGNTTMYGWSNGEGASSSSGPTKTITGNTFSNITGGSNQVTLIYLERGAATTCSSNTITDITGSGSITGISIGSNNGQGNINCASNVMVTLTSSGTGGDVKGITGGSVNVPTTNFTGNNFVDFSSTGASSTIAGIDLTGGSNVNISGNGISTLNGSGTVSPLANGIAVSSGTTVFVYNNKIYDITQSGLISATSPTINGMLFSNGATITAYNNFISNLNATGASLADAIRGISVTSATATSTYNFYYNSVYINASSTGANFGTSGIYHTTNTTATTSALNLIDNIIVNTSTANGAGITAAYRRSDATLTNYASTSDYNLFYGGTPGVSNLIYFDGINSDQTLTAYKTRVSTRDANSISAMPTFFSVNDLHLTTANCQLNGRGTPIGVIPTDIDGQTRDVTTPDIGADEFTATTGTALAGVTGSTVCENRIVSVTGTSYTSNGCDLIAKVVPGGGTPVSGNINTCVTLKATTQFFNSEPYVKRYTDVEPVNSATTATITLYVLQAEFDDYNINRGGFPRLPNASADLIGIGNLRVTQSHGVPTQYAPGYYPGSSEIIDPLDADIIWNAAKSWWEISFDVTSFSGFFIHSTIYGFPLTAQFITLTGRREGGTNVLTWKVPNEQNIRGYEVERSYDGQNFTSIGFVNSQAPGGNSAAALKYNFADNNFTGDKQYYRLKQTGIDGRIKISPVILIKSAMPASLTLSGVFPNPASSFVNVMIESPVHNDLTILLSDIHGRLLQTKKIIADQGTTVIPFNTEKLAGGTYLVKVICTNGCEGAVGKFVKQ